MQLIFLLAGIIFLVIFYQIVHPVTALIVFALGCFEAIRQQGKHNDDE